MEQGAFTTFSGYQVDPLNLKDADIRLKDIAHSLALTNRFAGHSRIPISVAQHSIWVSKLCGWPYRKEGLLHDAAEAYLGDMTRPVKHSELMEGFRLAEASVQSTVERAFNLNTGPEARRMVDQMDNLMVRFEYEIAFGEGPEFYYGPINKNQRGLLMGWRPMTWQEAETMFLMEWNDITRK